MAVDGGHANGEAPVLHAAGGDGPDVERSTDPEVLCQFRPSGIFYAHVGPTEVVDRVPVIADHGLYKICIRNRARARTRRLHGRYEALPGFVDVLAEHGAPTHAGGRVAEVHGDPFFGNQGPQRRIYEVISFCNDVIRYQVPLHPFHRLVYTNALLFPVRGSGTFEAAANLFCRLLRNWPKAVFLARSVATDLAVPIGDDAGLAEYPDQRTLVAAEENDAVDEDRSSRMSELPNPIRVPMFATHHRRAVERRFFRGRGLLPTEWSAGFLRASKSFVLSRWLPPVPDWEPKTDLWVATPVVVSYLEDSLRNEYSSASQIVYSEYYCNLIAAWLRTLQKDKVFVRLDEKTLRHFDVLDPSKLREAPDGEAAHALYGKMRRAMNVFTWGVVLKYVVRRDRDTGEARQVRVTVYETKEFGFCLRHACVDLDWAPDPNAPAHVAPVPPSHLGVWRRGRQTHPGGAYAVSGDRAGYHRPRSPRRDRSRSPRLDRSRSASSPRVIEATWPTRASSSTAVALFGSARVRDVRIRAPRGAAVSAVAHAWVEKVTGLRRAVERADGRGVESAFAIIGQAVARAVDGDANYERVVHTLWCWPPCLDCRVSWLDRATVGDGHVFSRSVFRAPRKERILGPVEEYAGIDRCAQNTAVPVIHEHSALASGRPGLFEYAENDGATGRART